MDRDTAQRAAAWWANHLHSAPVMDNGDGMQSLMMSLLAGMMPPLNDEQIVAFEQALVDELLNGEGDRRSIGVDYGPDYTLKTAAQAVGIDLTNRLPVKTMMWIRDGAISVSVGYGQQAEVV